MTTTSIQALKPFSYVNSGDVFSIADGEVVEIDSTLATGFISAGLAKVHSPVIPSGTKSITTNGTYNVSEYASASVDVDVLTVTYNANGGTGTVAPVYVAAGDSITLSDGTGLTAPEGKEFAGWAKTSSAQNPTVDSPYTPTANVTLYAVYTDAPAEEPEN